MTRNTQSDEAPKRLMRVEEVAAELNCSTRQVRKLQWAGELAFVKVGAGVRFERTEVESYIAKRTARRSPDAA